MARTTARTGKIGSAPSASELEIARLSDELENGKLRLAQAKARLEAATVRAEENLLFWQRRAVTVVGVANTAAMLALGTAFIQAENMVEVGRLILPPLAYFAKGVVVAGASVILEVFSGLVAFIYAINSTREPPTKVTDRVSEIRLPVLSFFRPGFPAVSGTYFAYGLMEAVGVVHGVVAAS